MPTPLAVQTIQQIKDSVERPEVCARLGTLEPSCSRRLRAARYIYGAVKIVDLLRNELTANQIEGYGHRYDTCSRSSHWCGDQLAAAKDLWSYVLCLDQTLSHERIRSTVSGIQIQDECARPGVCPTTCIEPPRPQCIPLVRAPTKPHLVPSTPPATYPCQPLVAWYPAALVPGAYCYPGLVWLPFPHGFDKA